jgi:hypothetical protein
MLNSTPIIMRVVSPTTSQVRVRMESSCAVKASALVTISTTAMISPLGLWWSGA